MIRFVHLLLLAAPTVAWSAPERVERPVPRTEIEFERGLDLEGEWVRPALRPVFAVRQGQFNPLIALRGDFDAEIRASVVEVP